MPAILHNPLSDLNINKSSFRNEVRRRVPWVLLSVMAGIIMIQIGQRYGEAFSQKIELVFFVPMIVYMSDSIGTETLALFVRELALKRVNLRHLFLKEFFVGLTLGLVSGVAMGLFSFLWLKDTNISFALMIAMTINGLIAVLVGMLTPIVFEKLGKDPALGTDEVTTAISDNLSMLVYLAVTTVVLFGFS